MRRFRLGIDVGGTFTDGILLDEATGESYITKVPSTPADPSVGFLECLDTLVTQSQCDVNQLWLVVHGTTVATNAIIQGKTAHTALVVTEGFKDILEIAYQIRPLLYDIRAQKPAPLVPRKHCLEVGERMGPSGEVIVELVAGDVHEAAKVIKRDGLHAVAVCFLHSYVNDAHEKRAGEILARELPGVSITLSSAISPEYREYPRASTAVINACVQPIVSRYVDKIGLGILERGVHSGCYLMQSDGGIASAALVKDEPIRIIESGPAAGVIISAQVARHVNVDRVICLDIGGTTAKVGMLMDGRPRMSREMEVGANAHSRSTARRGSGYPLRMPSIDLVEIGAGGGSLAWVDPGNVLRVGPESAGADPGPACYPQGGDLPTLTDANLLLGRLNPDNFLGGKMQLSVEHAHGAMERWCSNKVGANVVETSSAVIDVAVSNMVKAIRFLSVEQGYDPRDFTFIVTGGAGPLHANLIADELQFPSVIVPPSPGTASALGLLVSDLKHEVSASVLNLQRFDDAELNNICGLLREKVIDRFRKQAVPDDEVHLLPSADIRYRGQSYELNVEFTEDAAQSRGLEHIAELFHNAHQRTYGMSHPDAPVEFVTLRMTGFSAMPARPEITIPSIGDVPAVAPCARRRPVFFAQSGGMTECAIYDRTHLRHNHRVSGPAVIEEDTSTTVILPGYRAIVDKWGNLILSKNSR